MCLGPEHIGPMVNVKEHGQARRTAECILVLRRAAVSVAGGGPFLDLRPQLDLLVALP